MCDDITGGASPLTDTPVTRVMLSQYGALTLTYMEAMGRDVRGGEEQIRVSLLLTCNNAYCASIYMPVSLRGVPYVMLWVPWPALIQFHYMP